MAQGFSTYLCSSPLDDPGVPRAVQIDDPAEALEASIISVREETHAPEEKTLRFRSQKSSIAGDSVLWPHPGLSSRPGAQWGVDCLEGEWLRITMFASKK